MAVVSVEEIAISRPATDTKDGRTYTRIFRVRTDDITGTPILAIISAPGIPKMFDEHPDDTTVFVVARNPIADSVDRLTWIVNVKYESTSKTSFSSLDDEDTQPTDFPPEISFGFTQYEEVAGRFYDDDSTESLGNPHGTVENSSGEAFDPPLMTVISRLVITIQRNETDDQFDINKLADFKDSLNQFPITVAGVVLGIHEGRLRDIRAEKKFDDEGDQYWGVSYEIEVDRRTHVKDVVDRGFYELDFDSTGDPIGRIRMQDEDTPPKDTEVAIKLDGFGSKLALAADPVYLSFRLLPELDWNLLDLPVEE